MATSEDAQPVSSLSTRAGGSRSGSGSSSLLPTKTQANAGHTKSTSLSSKFGRFVETVLSSPTGSTTGSSFGGVGESGGAGRIHRGWVDLVPDQVAPSTQQRNPFIVQPQSSQSSQPPLVRRSTPSSTAAVVIPEECTPSSAEASSSGGPPAAMSASLPYTRPQKLPFMATRTTPSTPPSFSRHNSSSANSMTGSSQTTDRQVFVPASSPSLRSTWTHKTRPRANTTSSVSSPATPKWSWTGSLGKGFGTPTASSGAKGKGREPIDSGWGEPDDLSPDGERRKGEFEDEGFWEGLEGKKGFDIIASLPTEIALYIYLFLPVPTLAVCSRVSQSWNELASDSSIWRAYFNSNPSWRLRPSYLKSLAVPSFASRLGALALSSKDPITPTRRPAPPTRTPSSVSKVRELSHEDDFTTGHLGTGPVVPWKEVCEKRLWLDRRWGDEDVGGEMTLKGHSDSVYCLQFDEFKLVTGSRDQNIKVWDIATGTCLQTVHAHDASVLCLMFEEETGFMVSGGSDAKIIVWDLGGAGLPSKPLKRKQTLHGHRQGVLDIALNSEYIVSCSKDTTLLIHSRSTLEHLHTLRGHTGPVNAIGINGGQVASASGDGKIKIWDLLSGECVRTMEGHERGLACVDFKGEYIVSGSNDRTMKIWSSLTGECLRTLSGHTDLVRTLAMDPVSGRIVSGGYDKQILIWDLHSGEIVQTLKSSHTSLVFDIKFDSGRIVSASHDRLVIVHGFGDEESGRMFV